MASVRSFIALVSCTVTASLVTISTSAARRPILSDSSISCDRLDTASLDWPSLRDGYQHDCGLRDSLDRRWSELISSESSALLTSDLRQCRALGAALRRVQSLGLVRDFDGEYRKRDGRFVDGYWHSYSTICPTCAFELHLSARESLLSNESAARFLLRHEAFHIVSEAPSVALDSTHEARADRFAERCGRRS